MDFINKIKEIDLNDNQIFIYTPENSKAEEIYNNWIRYLNSKNVTFYPMKNFIELTSSIKINKDTINYLYLRRNGIKVTDQLDTLETTYLLTKIKYSLFPFCPLMILSQISILTSLKFCKNQTSISLQTFS